MNNFLKKKEARSNRSKLNKQKMCIEKVVCERAREREPSTEAYHVCERGTLCVRVCWRDRRKYVKQKTVINNH